MLGYAATRIRAPGTEYVTSSFSTMSTNMDGTPQIQSGAKQHPDFSQSTGAALLSSDEVIFYVSLDLSARSSSFFRNMAQDATPMTAQLTSEDSKTLAILLKLAHGLAINQLSETRPADIEPALTAALTYNFSGPAQNLLQMIELRSMRMEDPLTQFVLACRHNLVTLGMQALERCLVADLDFTALEGPLEGGHLGLLLNGRKAYMITLLEIIQSNHLADGPFFAANAGRCMKCGAMMTMYELEAWSTFQRRSSAVVMTRPSPEALWADARVQETKAKLQRIQCANLRCGSFPFMNIKRDLDAAWDSRLLKPIDH